MEDILQRVFSVIIATIIFFLLPLYMAFEKKDDISYSMALRITSNFVDNVANKGYISKNMYLDYITNLAMTDNAYDVTILHTAKKYYPVIYAKNGTTTNELDYSLYADKYEKYINGENVTINATTYNKTGNTLGLNYKLVEIQHTDKEILSICEGDIDTVGQTYKVDDNVVYPMSKGDEFTVVIKNTNTTIASILFNTLTMGINDGNDTKVYINYGGSIQNESYRKNALIGESTNLSNTMTEGDEEYVDVGDRTKAYIMMSNNKPVDTIYGDVDNNGEVNNDDLEELKKVLSGNTVTINKNASDLNFDNNITQKDSSILKRMLEANAGYIIEDNSLNKVNFYVYLKHSLGESYKEKLRNKITVLNGKITDISNSDLNSDGYYIYNVEVEYKDGVDKVGITLQDGLMSEDDVKFSKAIRVTAIRSNSALDTIPLTLSDVKIGKIISENKIQIMGKVKDESGEIHVNIYQKEHTSSDYILLKTISIYHSNYETDFKDTIVNVDIKSKVYDIKIVVRDKTGNKTEEVMNVTPGGSDNKIF